MLYCALIAEACSSPLRVNVNRNGRNLDFPPFENLKERDGLPRLRWRVRIGLVLFDSAELVSLFFEGRKVLRVDIEPDLKG